MTAGHEEHEPLISTSSEHQRVSFVAQAASENSENDGLISREDSPSQPDITIYIPTSNGFDSKKGYGSIVSPAAKEKVTYTWHDINVYTSEVQNKPKRSIMDCFKKKDDSYQKLGQKKHILRNVSGVAYPGELLAIMGSSGAGKTTLLNTLTFRSGSSVTVSGSRTVSGVAATPKALVSLAAYVQQDDMFIGTLTPREHLIFQALVRMDRHIPYTFRMQRVNEVISELALTKCQNTVIGVPGRLKGISGGEMKRLSFASEVLTDPPLMFCDEPTSGLDSFMAQNVIQVLKNLAQKGKTVVCTIHQPSSELYAMFDKLLLMAEGRAAFLGSPDEANRFFSEMGVACPANYNPADHFVQLLAVRPGEEVASRSGIEAICDAFEKHEVGQKMIMEAENATLQRKTNGWGMEDFWNRSGEIQRQRYKASWFAQFRAVLWRSWLSVIKEPMLIKVRFLQTIMVAGLIGIIYFGQHLDQDGVMNINGAIFMFLTNMTFQNVFAVINVFCSELPIFLRENRSGVYRTDVYFLCKTLAEAPIFAAIPIVFTAISYYMIGLNPEQPRFFIAAGVSVLVANVATSFGYFISCASSSTAMAVSIGPPLVIPFMLFGGFFLNAGSIPPYFKWLSYLSWFRYGNEALLINQWDGVDSIECTSMNTTCPRNGDVVLATLSFSSSDMIMDVVNLALLIIGFRIVAFLALLGRTYRKER